MINNKALSMCFLQNSVFTLMILEKWRTEQGSNWQGFCLNRFLVKGTCGCKHVYITLCTVKKLKRCWPALFFICFFKSLMLYFIVSSLCYFLPFELFHSLLFSHTLPFIHSVSLWNSNHPSWAAGVHTVHIHSWYADYAVLPPLSENSWLRCKTTNAECQLLK